MTCEFETALQDALDNGTVLELNQDIVLDEPVEVHLTRSHQQWHGLDGRFYKITSNVKGAPAIRVAMEGVHGVCARSVLLANLTLIGSGEETNGLMLDAPVGDSWIVNPLLQNLWIEGTGGDAGLTVRGSVFEGNLFSVGTMNCKDNGIRFANANGGICSAMRFFGGTQRQNGGNGIIIYEYDGPSDVRLHGLYFCENQGFGLITRAGIELVEDCGFENNHGGAAIRVENFCKLRDVTASTWGPQPYLLDGYVVTNFDLHSCKSVGYTNAYGSGDPRVAKLNGGDPRATVLLDNTDAKRCDITNCRVKVPCVTEL